MLPWQAAVSYGRAGLRSGWNTGIHRTEGALLGPKWHASGRADILRTEVVRCIRPATTP